MGIVNITGISDSRTAHVCGKLIREKGGKFLIITPTYIGAKRLAGDLSFFVDKKIHLLPTDEEGFVSYEAKNRDTMVERLRILRIIADQDDCIVVAPVSAAIKKLPPHKEFLGQSTKLKINDEININKTMEALVDMGYERVPLVYAQGQFAMRGGIIDVFTPYMDLPVRIELFDTVVEGIRTFDPQTQRSVEKILGVDIYPAELMFRNQKAFNRAKEKIQENYVKLPQRRDQLLDSLNNLTNIQHLEHYMDYFYDQPEYLWDYMGESTVIVDDPNRIHENLEGAKVTFHSDFQVFLKQGKVVAQDIDNFPTTEDYMKVYQWPQIYLCTPIPKAVKGIEKFTEVHSIESRQTLSYNGKMDLLQRELVKYLEKGYKVTIVCGTDDRYNNLKEFLVSCNLDGRVWVEAGSLTSGVDFPEEKICYITDGDIFGTYRRRRRGVSSKSKSNTQVIKTFADITKDDLVVHESHGIGRFIGMEQLTIGGDKKDFLKIQYAGEDVLYVPATQMDLIQKYLGKDSGHTRVNKLNGTEWRNTKAKAKASIANMAKELLEISAARTANPGYKFGPDSPWQREFEDAFPYEETDDQLRCIDEIKRDMEQDPAMDRLLCGDVGYGKTEVAARAMFKAAAEGKQVAVLVPTTILANQHYYTLKERFEKFPFTVEMLSRFRTKKEQDQVVDKLKKGTVDLVIGTHRLLNQDVKFKDLGLLVIDEEQRFGVAHKEKMKALRKNVDVLTLSATPIPRTLHMSLIGLRQMSVIEEPPEERYPVQTYVLEEDDFVIQEAIEKELDRGGQVYIVHNRVSSINRIAKKIEQLVPGKRIAVGHGQMGEEALEEVMISFMDGDFDILIATTIIESGIDIPNVNTVIIMDADRFGLSQLYQLRGRVGRSNRLAYAYLMHKRDKTLSEVAEKRLKAIKEFTEFGAGFKLSMRDLEIRGAGNVLGVEQHGHMINIGYELYCKLVDDAVRALKGEKSLEERVETTIDIKVSAFIPNKYIRDEIQKLTMYKKIAAIYTREDESEVIEELIDRYGEIPKETYNLITVAKIRSLAGEMGIAKITIVRGKINLIYSKKTGKRPIETILKPGEDPLEGVWQLVDVLSLANQG